ncbi:F0F1 ATP synthase subunit delta [Allokutzneria sp. A3M-2-11 16]|uniref:F0F1 ATP synthase subunit delta n=1 Tax=Allokutzneria sp. A3M-2-11 16 TaxID=2962043 RepID=UPI0020B7448C|nr:F0F1 ATP synthase subunit delta [Allokutzneria sp. A3M-2-11 16]MCP3798261.1 F0F1 ATP synthase subunit delta [Allokutzneria sp. A3M-2-11 16]
MSAMHAASREALASAEARLQEITSGVDGDGLGKLADELFAVTTLLNKEIGLRRAIADASSDPSGRESLVRGLLAGKVGERAIDLLATVVTARWSSPRELVDGIELLTRTVSLVRAEQDGRLDAVEDELFRLGRIIAAQPDLDRLLSDPARESAGKVELLRSLTAGKVEPVTQTLAEQLVAEPRGLGVVAGLEQLAGLAAKRRERSVAYVRSVIPLSEAQQDRLSALLQRVYSRPIALHIEVDAALRGGMVIRVGDEVIDGSAAGRLEALRRELAG